MRGVKPFAIRGLLDLQGARPVRHRHEAGDRRASVKSLCKGIIVGPVGSYGDCGTECALDSGA